jgi:hypothetical protein
MLFSKERSSRLAPVAFLSDLALVLKAEKGPMRLHRFAFLSDLATGPQARADVADAPESDLLFFLTLPLVYEQRCA